jgi:antitoxin PrlF
MPTAMVTFNGRITLPSQIRKQLGLRTGDSVDFVEVEKGRFAITPRKSAIVSLPKRVPSSEFPSVDEWEKTGL